MAALKNKAVNLESLKELHQYNNNTFETKENVKKTNDAIDVEKKRIDKEISDRESAITDIDSNKITKPAEAPTIGKIIRVKSVNEDGTFICEWADGASDLDVQINGESIVQNGIAEIPVASDNVSGVIKNYYNSFSSGLDMRYGAIKLVPASENYIKSRSGYPFPLVPLTLDYAVKSAMSAPIADTAGMVDGVYHYPAWTADEQKASLERQGIYDWELLFDSTLEEDVIQYVHQFQNPFKVKKLLFIVDSPITDLATEKSIYVFWNKTKKYDYPMSIAWKSGAKGKASRWYTFIDIIEDYSIAHSYGMLINSSSWYMNAADNIKPNSESYASQMIKEKLLSTICLQSIQQDGGSIDKGTHILLYGIKG